MEQEDRRFIGFRIRCLNNLVRRKLDERFARVGIEDISGIQGPVIGFIFYKGREKDIFQKDIEREFSIQRSTATVLLQNLEQKGMIIRQPVSHDARLKKIVLTEKAIQCHCRIQEQIDIFHRKLEEGISREEKEEMFRILDKLQENLSRL